MTATAKSEYEGIDLGQITIGGIPCSVEYIKRFKWQWLATQINLFTIVGHTEQPIDRKVIEDFSTACFQYALKNNKGLPRGFQAGVGSIAVLKGSSIDASAAIFCETLPKKHYSAFEIPVLYNTATRQRISYRNSPIWGAIYFPFFGKVIQTIFSKIDENKR